MTKYVINTAILKTVLFTLLHKGKVFPVLN
jgi:hypothetical protein